MSKYLITRLQNPKLILILSILITITKSNANEIPSNGRIVGGTVTTISKAMFTVYIRKKGEFICGGSLVSPLFVVTAAHCVKGVPAEQLQIIGGATYLSERGTRRAVSKVITPKDYNARTYDKDIAVLKLSQNMSGNNIGTVQLCKTIWKLGDTIDVFGWGQLSESKKGESQQLRWVTVPLMARQKCAQLYKGEGTITDTMFCAGDLKGKDACSGDSGGPAIYKNELCGVVSWGVGCARRDFPGVYTSVKTVRAFIDKAMKL